jgi:hypothetical protein
MKGKGKSKAIPLQAWTGADGSRSLRQLSGLRRSASTNCVTANIKKNCWGLNSEI